MWPDKESDSDYLNFGEVSQLAVDILTNQAMLPVSLGIFGNWGAGKSSLLKLIEKDLMKKDDQLIVNFDAWLYQGYDDARAALLEVIARKLNEATNGNDTLLKKAKHFLSRVNWFRNIGLLADGVAYCGGIPTGGLLEKGLGIIGKHFVNSESEDDKNQSSGILKPEEKITPPQQIEEFRQEYGEILEGLKKTLIVIIDNLDRCLPANAIHILEAIRLFLFLPQTAFVIAADEEMIRGAVAEYFKGTSTRHQIDYLDKLIQVPIRVPKAGLLEIRSYLFMLFAIDNNIKSEDLVQLRDELEKSLQQSWQSDPISKENALKFTGKADDPELIKAFELSERIAPILASSPIIHGNPRTVKRLLNVVKMRNKIAKRRSIPLDESVITKLVIFERCAGTEATAELYSRIDAEFGKPTILTQLEDKEISEIPKDAPDSWKKDGTKDFILKWSKLTPPLKEKDLRPAVYLSRETMPIGSYVVGLSSKGSEALQSLINTNNISSPTGKDVVKNLPLEEQIPVMEGILDYLRQITDWSKQPKGFAGACLLAQQSSDAALLLKRFLINIKQPSPSSPWINVMLKNEEWYRR